MKNLPDTAKIKGKHLEIGGCDAVKLAKEFGTPLYVLDEETIRNRSRTYVHSFRKYHQNTEIAYACKALCVTGLLKIIASEGLGLDVSSGGEIFTALRAGCDLKKAYFHGNNKTKEELEFALKNGVGRIVVDHQEELENLEEVARKIKRSANILLRINPGIEAHTHEYIKTGTLDSKFGVPQNEIEKTVKAAKSKKLINFKGFHAHIGSQIVDARPFVDEVKLLLGLAKKYGMEEINIGGGVGIAYLGFDDAPEISSFARDVCAVLKNDKNIKLTLEPGRSIVGTAGVTLYTIGAVKDIPGIRKYIFIDGGMADNPRPILYQAKYDARIANKADQKPAEKVTVAGRFCESGDILIKDISLPKVEVGDILAVFSTGAYNYSMASNYNRVGRPAMVLVKKGKAKLILKRESYEDLSRHDLGGKL